MECTEQFGYSVINSPHLHYLWVKYNRMFTKVLSFDGTTVTILCSTAADNHDNDDDDEHQQLHFIFDKPRATSVTHKTNHKQY